jgi:hypothetical protein
MIGCSILMADGNEFPEKLEWAYKAITYHLSPAIFLMDLT